MSGLSYNFNYDEFKNPHNILEKSKFDIIYNEFNNHNDEQLILDFCHNLYKINIKINGWENMLFNEFPINDKTYCISLKYWLYERIDKLDLKGQKIHNNVQQLKEMLESKINSNLSVPCAFNELEWNEHQKLRSIYAFMLIYYSNLDKFHNKLIDCKYINYMGEGLKEYNESLKKCSTEKDLSNYCKEFNEFKEIYKEDYLHWKTSTVDKAYIYSDEDTVNCALQIESLKDIIHLSYWNKKEKIHLSNYPFDSQKSAVISASSAIGATAGISLFLIYLYKFTNIGSFLGHVNQKNNTMFLNMDTEPNNPTQPNSEFENSNFESSHFDISYYLFNNS
ncbi:PIR Superfamily Protein [Plasmodium ovale wallikeri]|uniref:PIR Superfamily Protein n=1 Tax=Plasmodium ovale wallikeri TaxID=864142 RepID=A0A1A9ALM5_PLAOA|nr:PIR Superfamily Protein [Plasmodium ovale wallikeri]